MFRFFKRRKLAKAAAEAAADGEITSDERAHLLAEGRRLGLRKEEVDAAHSVQFQTAIAPIMERINRTARLSPDDQAELEEIAERFNVNLDMAPNLRMARELWAAEHGEQVHFPIEEAPFLLKPGETCCYCVTSIWKQLKVTKQRVGYSGFSTSIRIMKGVSYRVGNVTPTYVESEGLADISPGELCITDRRLVFEGVKRSTSITWGRLIDVELYANGIEVRKTTGKPDIFSLSRIEAEFAAMAIAELSR